MIKKIIILSANTNAVQEVKVYCLGILIYKCVREEK